MKLERKHSPREFLFEIFSPSLKEIRNIFSERTYEFQKKKEIARIQQNWKRDRPCVCRGSYKGWGKRLYEMTAATSVIERGLVR